MIMKKALFALFLAFFTPITFAEGTRSWTQDSYDEFARGTTRSVAISSRGILELAPVFKQMYSTPSTFLWAIAAGNDGAVFVAGGSPARVYRVESDGTAQTIFEPKELQVQSLAVVGDVVYAATSPDGKIYKLTPSTPAGKGTPKTYAATDLFDPQTKYIWQILATLDGTVFAATGDRGEIYRIGKDGKGTVFFKSDEAHIRSLAFDRDGNVIAGTDGSGLIYRISKQGEAFVLYSGAKKEVTALAVANDGTIYAAAVGEKRVAAPPPAPVPAPPAAGGQAAPAPAPFTQVGGSEVYAIAPDGAPARIWSSRDELVYALGFDPAGDLIAGTGNKGKILLLRPDGDFTELAKASANQVVALASAGKLGTYVASSNLGKIFLLGAGPSDEGSFESEVLDARLFSKWGRANVRGKGNYEFAVRSGNVDNPDRNWSPWKTVQLGKDAKLEVPASRFLQWRVMMRPASGGTQVSAITLHYLPKNVAPVIDDIVVQTGARLSPTAPSRGNATDSVAINFNQPKESPAPTIGPRNEGSLNAQRERGYNTVRWAAHDDNEDDLLYTVYYRGENESRWKLLKANVTDKYYSFDSGLMPDGNYQVRVTATDASSHTPEEALTNSREGSVFEVDNTPPQISALAAKVEGDELHVSFSAADAISIVARAEYSVDGADWKFLEPVGQLSDAKVETYDFNVEVARTAPKAGNSKAKKKTEPSESAEAEVPLSTEHVVVVRVFDKYENSSVAKTVAK
jgi:hypothetical protein